MASAAVMSMAPPPKIASSIPNVESLEGFLDGSDDYQNYKKLQAQLEYIQLQEEYIKDEQRYLTICSQKIV